MKVSDILFRNLASENENALMQLKGELRKKRSADEWILGLGAGVSISVGLPDWYKLLSKITAQVFPLSLMDSTENSEDAGASFRKSLKEYYDNLDSRENFWEKWGQIFEGENKEIFQGINQLEAAEYIFEQLEGIKRYSKKNDNEAIIKKKANYYVNHMIQNAFKKESYLDDLDNTTLLAVSRLMKSEKDSLIHNAITYNYDNLLEECLRKECKCDENKIHSIDKGDNLPGLAKKDGWNIYHVHGRIPVVEHDGEQMSEAVILSESAYYHEEEINYSWTNILQSYVMLSKRMIFIGFSGADYNFRRLVKYIRAENKQSGIKNSKHYIFFCVDDIVKTVFLKQITSKKSVEECIRDMNDKPEQYAFEKMIINYLINAQSYYWDNKGFKVIWSSHQQLYDDLEKLH